MGFPRPHLHSQGIVPADPCVKWSGGLLSMLKGEMMNRGPLYTQRSFDSTINVIR